MALTSRFYLTVAVTVIGASFQFYSFAVLNTTQMALEAWIQSAYSTRYGGELSSEGLVLFWSFVVSILSVGATAVSLATHAMAERFGRRGGLILNGIINVLGGVCEASAKAAGAPELLMLGRLILGFNVGVSCGLAPLYLTEIAPVSVRGAVGTCHQIAAAFGDWFCMVLSLPWILGGGDKWPAALSFPALPALLLCAVLPFCPESPRYLLVKRGDRKAAAQAAYALTGEKSEAESLVGDLELEIEASQQMAAVRNWSGWWRRPELYKPLTIVVVAMIAQQFTGIAAVLSFSSSMFAQAGLGLHTSQLATVGVGFAYFLATLPALCLIERLGRRFLSLCQLSGCLVCLCGLTFLQMASQSGEKWAAWATIGVLAVYMAIYGLGSSVPWLIASELFAQEYRSTAVSVGTFTSFSVSFLVSTAFLPLQEVLGPAWAFAPFVGILTLCTLFLAWQLPETKGRQIHDIVRSFADGPPLAYAPIASESDWRPGPNNKVLLPWKNGHRRYYQTFPSSDDTSADPEKC